ncbi:MAG: SWIM zinc finger domain-containing protein [Desulfomonile tiedjei]|uniref:SWIM zinc finger domain-containing protein n=1 Tax=Desulfomonile tiedjei TaxID=2358 RepID=A0A9D6V2C1_9BACT|nr:SWIM zinc finger domain-containing protein [Desulfomonile tiedjei]
MAKHKSNFAELTWDDLMSWAGAKILARGKSCRAQVRDLCLTSDGGVLAWVDGTQAYATLVNIEPSGNLTSICSCPYDSSPCKHSVALVLAYLDGLKSKQVPPKASPDDRRLRLIRGHGDHGDSDSDSSEDYDEESDTDYGKHDPAEDLGGSAVPKGSSARKGQSKKAAAVRRRLESMSKEQLIDLVITLVDRFPEILQRMEDEEQLKGGRVTKIVRSIRKEIEELAAEPARWEHWSGEGYIPDYSRVRERLESLLEAGHADEVVHLGKDLWRLGNRQLESSDDEGETGDQIAECMQVIFRAVPNSSLSPRDQLLWIIDACLQDEFGLLDDSDAPFSNRRYDKKVWGEVTDTLLTRLEKMPLPDKKSNFSAGYRRQEIMSWAIEALHNCGRKREIIPLLQREVTITQCYCALTDHMIAAGMRAEAKAAAVDGFQQTMENAPGIAWNLEAKLCKMAEQDKDLPLVASYRALEFFNRPSLDSYMTLEKAARAARQWSPVREAVIKFLETGARPDLPGAKTTGKTATKAAHLWPLPATPICVANTKPIRQNYPDITTLIRIAIHEKDTPQILRWYETAKKDRFVSASVSENVAEAVKKSHPDISLEIWRASAETEISLVKPSAYEVAARYLRRMKDIYERTNRLPEWKALLTSIRIQHKLKRSLMPILDALEARRIIEG